MNCLIFGATGLIGKHLTFLLQETNCVVTIGREKSDTVFADLEVDWTFKELPDNIDEVVYLAQSQNFRNFPEAAEQIFRVNALSLLKALDYARNAGAKTFVYASSGGVYGNTGQVYEEETPIGPRGELGFYLGTKMCGEIIAESYTPFMNVITLRPFFVYGPGQRKDMLIPRLIERVRNDLPIQLIGENGTQINPTYVDDAVQAIIHALAIEKSCTVNIGGPEVLTIRQIGECIGQVLRKEVNFEQEDGTPDKIVGSVEKMSELLWRPRICFEEGIKRYINSDYRGATS